MSLGKRHDARRSSAVVALAGVAALFTACARIMGVDDATLLPPDSEAGTSIPTLDDSGSYAIDSGCIGPGCACARDEECRDPVYKVCVGGTCQGCTTTPDSCPVGRYCLAGSSTPDAGVSPWSECAPGCQRDSDCATLSATAKYCLTDRHRCVACKTKADCPAAQDCSPSGACADTCGADGGTCPDPTQTCCNRFCVDTKTDPLNCNGCGLACDATALCCQAACTNTLNDVGNCGACGVACSAENGAPSCTSGSCKWACTPGFHHCAMGNTGCETRTSDNLTQCGSCTTSCSVNVVNANGVACATSACTFESCKPGFGNCDSNQANGCECACGKETQPCCSGACDPGLACALGICKHCGRDGEPCCAAAKCGMNLFCGSGSTCQRCRNKNESCNSNAECCGGTCHSNHTCK